MFPNKKVIITGFISIALLVILSLISFSIYLVWSLLDGNPTKAKMVEAPEFSEEEIPTLHTSPVVDPPVLNNSNFSGASNGVKISSPDVKPKRLNFLALGLDARSDTLVGRADAIVVLSVDKENRLIDMVSIPRDSYVQIGDMGKYDKINHSFAYGGVELTKKTVENLLGITIDHYAVFNFYSFVELIDTLGGIEIDVPFAFSEQDSRDRQNAIRLEKGLQVLNGEQALAYARMRRSDPSGDIGRGKRQQEVISAIIDKLLSSFSISTLVDIHSTLKKNFVTDVSLVDLPSLSGYFQKYTINQHVLSGKGVMINGIYYYQLDGDSLAEVISKFQGKVTVAESES